MKGQEKKTLEVGCPGLCPVGLNYLIKTLRGMGVNVVRVDYPDQGGVKLVLEGNISNIGEILRKMGYRVSIEGSDACCPECAKPENYNKRQT